MALDYSRTVTVDTSLGAIHGADADADAIYVFGRSGNNDNIYTITPDGVVTDTTAIAFSSFNNGLARVGDGFAICSPSGNTGAVRLLNSSGTATASRNVISGYRGQKILFRASDNTLFALMREARRNPRHRVYSLKPDGSAVTLVANLSGTENGFRAAAMSSDTVYIPFSFDDFIDEYDSGFAALNSNFERHSSDTGNVNGLAFKGEQLIVFTGSNAAVKMAFYGPEPEVPEVLEGRIQLPSDIPTFERFTFVTGFASGKIQEVIQHNVLASRSTDLSLREVFGSLTLSERLALVTITPRKTIPQVKTGTKIFLSADETEPTDEPSGVEVWNVIGIISAGNAYTQTYVCELVV